MYTQKRFLKELIFCFFAFLFIHTAYAKTITSSISQNQPTKKYFLERIGVYLRHRYAILNLVAEKNPALYAEFVDKIKLDMSLDANFYQNLLKVPVEQRLSRFFAILLDLYLIEASDESIYGYLNATIRYYEALLNIEPTLILKSEFPSHFRDFQITKAMKKILLPELEQKVTYELTLINRTVNAKHQRITPNKQNAEPMMLNIFRSLILKYGKGYVVLTFEDPSNPTLDRTVEGKILIDFYKEIFALGAQNAAALMRYLIISGKK